jgi:hypothetical protein
MDRNSSASSTSAMAIPEAPWVRHRTEYYDLSFSAIALQYTRCACMTFASVYFTSPGNVGRGERSFREK